MRLAACLSKHSCITRRDSVMRLPSIWTWNDPCTSCVEGLARKMDGWKPEADLEPKPLRDYRKPPAPPPKCSVCGKVISRGSSLCKKCWGIGRRVNHLKCSVGGCRWKARRNGMCQTHYWKAKNVERRATA